MQQIVDCFRVACRAVVAASLLVVVAMTGAEAQEYRGWSAAEVAAANTAAGVVGISAVERDAITYLNLARLFPRKFADVEVMGFYGFEGSAEYGSAVSDNRLTLIAELYGMKPCGAVTFSAEKLREARCLAGEQSRNGEVGHKRHKCASSEGGECCSYGMNTGLYIVLQLLIDEGVPDLGHRDNCLNAGFGSVGVAFASHPRFEHVAVMDLGWGDYDASTTLRYRRRADIDKPLADSLFAAMTCGLPKEIRGMTRSHVTSSETSSTITQSGDGSGTEVETLTLHHENGKVTKIETTYALSADGTRREVSKKVVSL